MERSAGEGSLLRDPKVMVVLLRGQASFLNSANRTHPTTLANSTSHFSLLVGESAGPRGRRSPREKGRRGSGSVGRGGKLLLGGEGKKRRVNGARVGKRCEGGRRR